VRTDRPRCIDGPYGLGDDVLRALQGLGGDWCCSDRVAAGAEAALRLAISRRAKVGLLVLAAPISHTTTSAGLKFYAPPGPSESNKVMVSKDQIAAVNMTRHDWDRHDCHPRVELPHHSRPPTDTARLDS
jgi:hypothetical protein